VRRRLPAAAAVAAATAIVAVAISAWPFTVDDAYIVARYASRIAAGDGYTMDDGPPTDGVTGPLWLVPMILARLLGSADPIAWAKIAGVICAALAAIAVVERARSRAGGRRAATAVAALVACGPTIGIWSVAGLETGAATLAMTVAALAATARPLPRGVVCGVALGALAWLRPEAAVAGIVLVATLAMRDRARAFVAASVAGAVALGVVLFRVGLFGDPVPMSFQAKPGAPDDGFFYVLRAVVVSTSVIGVGLAAVAVRRGRDGDRAIGAALVAHLAAVTFAGGDWMPGYRLVAPVLPMYALLAGEGAAALARARRLPGGRRGRAFALVALVAVTCALPAVDLLAELPAVRDAGRTREAVARPLARWLAVYARRVALVDVGYLAYESGLPVVDLGGLTDPRIARAPGGHLSKQIDAGLFALLAPDTIVLHAASEPVVTRDGSLWTLPSAYPVERRVATFDWVRSSFRVVRVVRYSPGYVYVVLARQRGTGGRAGATADPSVR